MRAEPRGSVSETVHTPAEMAIVIPAIAEDGSTYPVEKLEAHRRGLLHLAVSIFVFDDDALLLQRRAAGKYHCGGLWANTCCSHPHWGENPNDSAHRRLTEELGFTLPLRATGVTEYRADVGGGLIEHERVHLFRGTADRGRLTIEPNPDEVCETCWMTETELADAVARRPEDFTPWLRIYLSRRDVPFAA